MLAYLHNSRTLRSVGPNMIGNTCITVVNLQFFSHKLIKINTQRQIGLEKHKSITLCL